ncbi:hypothetical protein KUTeg_017748, partial [Tegillarca granosa]
MKRRTLAKPPSRLADQNLNGIEERNEGKVSANASTSKNDSKKGGCKRLITLCQVLILIIIAPPFLNYASIQREITALKPENGELYDIGWGQKMYMKCEGHGPPTVIFEAPAGMTSDVWTFVVPKIAKHARVCVYDRAGLGFSDRPYENYTDKDGSESKSNQRNKWLPFTLERYGNLIPSFQSLQLGAALGITRLALLIGLLQQPMSGIKDIPEDIKHLLCHPKHLSSVVDEHHFINESFSQLKTVRMLKALPQNISVTVISGNYYDEQIPSYLNKAWAKSERNLITKYYPTANHIFINNADRHMIYRNPSAIIETINRIIRQWKNKLKSSKPCKILLRQEINTTTTQ